jgi:ZIP family zinc transporter
MGVPGILLGGIPESIAVGLTILHGGAVSVTAVAAGAMLTMIVDTMIPEAFAATHDWAGLIAVLGFLVSSALSEIAG